MIYRDNWRSREAEEAGIDVEAESDRRLLAFYGGLVLGGHFGDCPRGVRRRLRGMGVISKNTRGLGGIRVTPRGYELLEEAKRVG